MSFKLTILVILIIFFALILCFTTVIVFAKLRTNFLITKIDKLQQNLSKYLKEINSLLEQSNAYFEASKIKDKNFQNELIQNQLDFEEIQDLCSIKLIEISNKLKNHKQNHNFMELNCLFSILNPYKKALLLYKNGQIIYKFIKTTIQEKILFPSKLMDYVLYLKNKDKKINVQINAFKITMPFFNEQFRLIDESIFDLYSHFIKEKIIETNKKINITKIVELNNLIIKKILIFSHGSVYYDLIFNKIPKIINNLKNKQSITDTSLLQTFESQTKCVYNENFSKYNITLKNELELLDFSKDDDNFKEKLFKFISTLEDYKNNLQFEQTAKTYIADIEKKLSFYHDKFLKKQLDINSFFEKYKGNVDTLDAKFNVMKYLNNELNKFMELNIKNVNTYLEKNEVSSYNEILNNLKSFLIELKSNISNQNNLDYEISLYQNKIEHLKLQFQKLQSIFAYLVSICYQLNIDFSKNDLTMIKDINTLQNQIVMNNEQDVNINFVFKNNVLKYHKLVMNFFEIKAIEIEAAKLTKIVIQKISPLCSSQEIMMELYLKLTEYNNTSQYIKAIEHLDNFIKNKIN
ncbi:hypothetical protein [Metamycoplasma salivarium]|uniref:hypothetical protein n=1 Tax=Metamycoplasma salivarium TaxID=2124 RepID=UPI001F162D81|nr:hypothetical protein [Metamycoplasma salivarium]GIZ06423.1 hypothetical protein MSATCC23557_3950 [Metamycoplasma salivarium]